MWLTALRPCIQTPVKVVVVFVLLCSIHFGCEVGEIREFATIVS